MKLDMQRTAKYVRAVGQADSWRHNNERERERGRYPTCSLRRGDRRRTPAGALSLVGDGVGVGWRGINDVAATPPAPPSDHFPPHLFPSPPLPRRKQTESGEVRRHGRELRGVMPTHPPPQEQLFP
ncbi:hypothetical protein GW17_00029191 [Ensete ventricosum]|nr:hypothetical protein GW17_00029191 [Ensete ventricosum]